MCWLAAGMAVADTAEDGVVVGVVAAGLAADGDMAVVLAGAGGGMVVGSAVADTAVGSVAGEMEDRRATTE